MLIAEQIAAAVADARTLAALDNLARLTWRGFAEAHIAEDDAQALGCAIEARRTVIRSGSYGYSKKQQKPAHGPRRAPRTPDRQRSIERRRRIAASGAIPPSIACRFTTAEVAVLSVIAREVQRRGQCELPVDAIAALAGVCRRTVQNAMKAAMHIGVILVKERRRRGAPSLTNVVQLAEPSWRAWLRLSGGQGEKRCAPRNTKLKQGYRSWGESPEIDRSELRSGSVLVRIGHAIDEDGAHGDPIRSSTG
jgi:hypothetical protein